MLSILRISILTSAISRVAEMNLFFRYLDISFFVTPSDLLPFLIFPNS